MPFLNADLILLSSFFKLNQSSPLPAGSTFTINRSQLLYKAFKFFDFFIVFEVRLNQFLTQFIAPVV